MMYLTRFSRRGILLVALFGMAVGWQTSALAENTLCWWDTYGNERDDDELMVEFEIKV